MEEVHCGRTWRDKIRMVFDQICDLWSLIPAGVNIMALTTTTTFVTLTIVRHRLSVVDPIIVALPPNKENEKH